VSGASDISGLGIAPPATGMGSSPVSFVHVRSIEWRAAHAVLKGAILPCLAFQRGSALVVWVTAVAFSRSLLGVDMAKPQRALSMGPYITRLFTWLFARLVSASHSAVEDSHRSGRDQAGRRVVRKGLMPLFIVER